MLCAFFRSLFLGVGKTTLIQKVTQALKSSGVPIDGFYTQEVREGGRRTGFDVVTLSGNRGPLSRVRYWSFNNCKQLIVLCVCSSPLDWSTLSAPPEGDFQHTWLSVSSSLLGFCVLADTCIVYIGSVCCTVKYWKCAGQGCVLPYWLFYTR